MLRAERIEITWKDRVIYIMIIASFFGVLCVPFIPVPTDNSGLFSHIGHTCIWKRVTRLPCPTCGYTRSMQALVAGNLKESLGYQPFTLGYLALFAWMAFKSAQGLLERKPFLVSNRTGILIFIMLGIGWIVKFLLPRQYW